MSLLNYLGSKQATEVVQATRQEEVLTLDDQLDEDALEKYWDQVEQDIQSDPEWFNFS